MERRTRKGSAGASSIRGQTFMDQFVSSFDKEEKKTYLDLLKMDIVPNRSITVGDLVAVGLKDDVWHYLARAGWLRFVKISEPCYKELFIEFLATLEINGNLMQFDREKTINFRLGGKRFSMSITQFALSCGFYSEEETRREAYLQSRVRKPHRLSTQIMWGEITTNGGVYYPSRSKSTKLNSLAMRFIHRFMSFSATGRGGSSNGVVNHTDLLCLYGMHAGWQCNLGALFARYFRNKRFKYDGPLLGGTYITRLAHNLGVLEPRNQWTKICDMGELGMDLLRRMKIVELDDNDQYCIVRQPNRDSDDGSQDDDDDDKEEMHGDEQHMDDVGVDLEMVHLEADVDDNENHPPTSFNLEMEVRALRAQQGLIREDQVVIRVEFESFRAQYLRELAQQSRHIRWMRDSLAQFYRQSSHDIDSPPPSPANG